MTPHSASSVRPPAVAGLFYPAEAGLLTRTVSDLLAGVDVARSQVPKALIAPHAGYVYSGPIAAHAYARLAAARGTIKRVVLLGPTHRVAVRGLAIPRARAFATPLGTIELDAAAIESIRELPQVVVSDEAHALEHSLEVHLPFLQTVLGDFKLVPLAVGYAEPADVAAVIEALVGWPRNADRRELRSLALSALRGREKRSIVRRARRCSRCARTSTTTRRAEQRR